MKELILAPWPWYVAGPIIALVYFLLNYFGKQFGISSNLRTICAILPNSEKIPFFNFNWKSQIWNLMFVLGSMIGGYIAFNYMMPEVSVDLAQSTTDSLDTYGITSYHKELVPHELFSFESLKTLPGFILMIVGGFLVGFGTRWAGGCTSGHAISGLANLQVPSLVAVIGFFIGGLIGTHLVLPFIFSLL